MIGDTLKRLRTKKGLTSEELCSKIGIKGGSYRNYERNDRKPDYDTLVKLADFYGVSTDYLLGRLTAQPPTDALERLFSEKSFSALEEELLRKYMELPHEARQAVVRFINDATAKALQRKNGTAPQKLLVMKRSLHKVSAGTGYDLNDSDAWETVTVKDTDDSRKADFLLEIEGDSMETTFHDGETVCVQQTPSVEVGEIGVFWVDGCGYIKELGKGCLISHNSSYDPISLQGTENRCIGRVLGTADVIDD
ncbi:XRE family transcriptional regulator [Ruminococcus callidus]|uniref:XRE family transcriptional regulator n=1 Tax=Ruminococcus callidus TaxID=40519 RepID=UPI003FD89C54